MDDKQKLETEKSEGKKPEAYFRPLPAEKGQFELLYSRLDWDSMRR